MMTSSSVYILMLIAFLFVQNTLVASQDYVDDNCTLKDGGPGMCKMFSDCPWLLRNIKKSKNFYSQKVVRCGFEGSNEIICCQESPSKRIVTRRRKHEIACESFPSYEVPIADHVINGELALLEEFPFIAALGYTSDISGKNIDWNCGASLISDRYLLTAAHCIGKSQGIPKVARLGVVNMDDTEGVFFKDIQLKKTITHPNKTYARYHDIALLELEKPVKFDKGISPICLYNNLEDLSESTDLYAEGWGAIDYDGSDKTTLLQKVKLHQVPLAACKKSFDTVLQKDKRLSEGITEGQLCTMGTKKNDLFGDTCQGDSGGPLQILVKDKFYLVGITSFGIGCGTNYPSIFTRVAYYLDWIESIVWQ